MFGDNIKKDLRRKVIRMWTRMNWCGMMVSCWVLVLTVFSEQQPLLQRAAYGTCENWPWIYFQVERYVDRKLDKAEDILKRRERKARSWYHTFITGEKPCQLKGIHIFLVGFAAGLAIGIASGHWTIYWPKYELNNIISILYLRIISQYMWWWWWLLLLFSKSQ
jgi:hypothetical protein